MINKFNLVIFLLLVPFVANADFLVELDAGYSFGEITYDPDDSFSEEDDYTRYSIGGEIYLGLVDTDNVPFQEAGFLSKKSSVTLSYDREVFDEEFGGDFEIKNQGIEGRFVIPGPSLILMASMFERERGYNSKNDSNGFGVGIGFYTGKNGALSFEYKKIDHEFFAGPDDTETVFNLNYKHVAGSGVRRVAFSVFGQRSVYDDKFFDEEDEVVSLGGDVKFYINQRLSVGAGLQINIYDFSDGDDGVGAVFTPQIAYDFSENFGFYANIHSEAAVFDIDDDDDSVDVTTRYITIGAKVRF